MSKENSEQQRASIEDLRRRQIQLWDPWIPINRPRGWTVDGLMKAYAEPFLTAVKKCHAAWNPKHLIDHRLRGRATQSGELVVFDRPFPIYESSPRASFRGARRINGNELIQQIAGRRNKAQLTLRVNYCAAEASMKGMLGKVRGGEPRQIVTKGQLTARLGEDLHESKASCIRLLNKLSQMAQEQVHCFGKFKLPGIGTIFVRGKKDRKRIRFTAAKAISGKI